MIVFLLVIIVILSVLTTFRLLYGDGFVFRPPFSDDENIPLPSKASIAPEPVALPEAIDLPMEEREANPAPTEKFERLLLEKNNLIDRLQREVEAERSHRLEFDKVRELMSEEIARLKQQNRSLKIPKES